MPQTQSMVVLLRSVNVGGKNKIKMAELKTTLAKTGFLNPETYIQSGNVLVESPWTPAQTRESIRQLIQAELKLAIDTVVLAKKRFLEIAAALPFADADVSKCHVTFLNRTVKADELAVMDPFIRDGEQVRIDRQIVYLHCPHGYGTSKLTNGLFGTKMEHQRDKSEIGNGADLGGNVTQNR
ncbi:MAG: DUF1697 domain-containing protein [Pirellulaceae bacterium]